MSLQLSSSTPEALAKGRSFVASRFPAHDRLRVDNATVSFRIASEALSVVFGHVLAARERIGIKDFAVSHTTLDEVPFLF